MQINKVKARKPGKKGLKERAATAPKQLLRRGLDDGTERLRGQFRDASQRGQRDDYGGDRIEDTAWTGTRWAGRGVEKLLKKKRGGRDRGPEAEPAPPADSPETELPLEGPVATDPPRQGGAEERVRIKTRKATAQKAEGPQRVSRGRPTPSSLTRSATEKPSHVRTEPPKIKTREYFQQGVFSHGDVVLPSTESPAPKRSPRSRIQEIRQIFRRRELSTPSLRQEVTFSQPRASQMPPLTERVAKGTSVPQRFPDIKTKDIYPHRQATAPMELPAQERTQGGREFIQEQGRREAMRRAEVRRSRTKNAPVPQADSRKSTIQKDITEWPLRPSTAEVQSSAPPLQRQDVPGSTGPKAEKPATQATKSASFKEKKAGKASKTGIKNSRQTMKATDRSAKAAQKTAQATAKAPQRAVKAAHATAKTGRPPPGRRRKPALRPSKRPLQRPRS